MISAKLDRRSLENGLRAAIAAQMKPITEMTAVGKLEKSIYQNVQVDPDWLVLQITNAFLISLFDG